MKPFLTVVFASHADSKICGHTKMFRWQMIIIVRSCSIPIFLEKESGVCRLECFIVFEGILFEFGKTVRILSRIFWVYVARAWITQDIIVHSTCAYPYSGKFSREYVPFCAVNLFTLYNNIFFIVHVLFMIVCCLIFLASSISSPISQVCSVYAYWLWWIKRVLLANHNQGNILNE